jgi:Pectate lyase superfamily protein
VHVSAGLKRATACYPFFLLLILFPGLAQAGDEQQINERLKAGGTVYLSAGVYEIEGPIIIRSDTKLTGDPEAVIRVSSSSSQWFTGSTGIISCKESLKSVEVCGFQIDGNIGALPASYANTPRHNKDCERCILFGGDSGKYAENIKIHDMKLYNSFSDGIYY